MTNAARVDLFLANSAFVAQRIERYYRREAAVLNPPAAIDDFASADTDAIGDHYLIAGELVAYRRVDWAVRAFTRSGRRLRVVGEGDQRATLQRMAGPNVEFLGRLPLDRLRHELATCRALVFPGEEDFGIILVEVMAAGRPVIAFERGRVLDSVLPGVTGEFFAEQSDAALDDAIARFETAMLSSLDVAAFRTRAERFPAIAFERGWPRLVGAGKDGP